MDGDRDVDRGAGGRREAVSGHEAGSGHDAGGGHDAGSGRDAVGGREAVSGREIEAAKRLLAERFGHDGFLQGQEEALASVFGGRNLLVVMPTGSGKSLIYQLPPLMEPGLTIVVSPLISLMKDQVDELRRLGVRATAVNSSLGRDEQRARMALCAGGEVDLLYIAPERCRDAAFLAMLEQVEVSRLAVDEAHCISEWGHDFRPDYRRLQRFRESVGSPPTIALTATATPRVQRDIVESLGLSAADTDVHVHGFDRPNLVLSVQMAHNDDRKLAYLSRFLRENEGAGIIYAGTRKNTEDIVEALRHIEPSMVAYHAGMEPEGRTASQDAFLGGKARVVAATSAFGMGIDKRDVRFVVHYSYPGSVEQYYQEIGRAGRDGLESQCVLLYSSADRGLREFFIDVAYPDAKQVERVYKALWETAENPVLRTYREIASGCEERLSEGQVGTAVRMLHGAGVVRAYEGEPKVAVTLARPYAELKNEVRGPLQLKVLEALAASNDLEEPGRFEAGLVKLASDAGVTTEQVRRALAALRDGGLATYEPPFRGRGIEKTTQAPVPFDEIAIDWKHQEMMRGLEEEKLLAMERFINHPGCRRGYILRYFGESESFACGTCDYCVRMKAGSGGAGDIIEREPDVALPLLACVRFMRFPIGKNRTADVVTGSRNRQLIEWKLDGNPAYGLVGRKKSQVMEVIEQLLVQGYLRLTGDSGFPVLELTELGEETAMKITATQLRRQAVRGKDGAAAPRTDREKKEGHGGRAGRPRRFSSSADTEVVARVLECVDKVPFPLGVAKTAAVLTGSKSAWIRGSGIEELEVYGCLGDTQERVREVIASMLDEHLLARSGNRERPTLKLTEKGRLLL